MAINNLLENAINYSPENTKVSVSVTINEDIVEIEEVKAITDCMAVTYFLESDTLIHWHKVCGKDLERFRNYPSQQPVCETDSRIMTLVIAPDKCE
jgi:hypothetical protein